MKACGLPKRHTGRRAAGPTIERNLYLPPPRLRGRLAREGLDDPSPLAVRPDRRLPRRPAVAVAACVRVTAPRVPGADALRPPSTHRCLAPRDAPVERGTPRPRAAGPAAPSLDRRHRALVRPSLDLSDWHKTQLPTSHQPDLRLHVTLELSRLIPSARAASSRVSAIRGTDPGAVFNSLSVVLGSRAVGLVLRPRDARLRCAPRMSLDEHDASFGCLRRIRPQRSGVLTPCWLEVLVHSAEDAPPRLGHLVDPALPGLGAERPQAMKGDGFVRSAGRAWRRARTGALAPS